MIFCIESNHQEKLANVLEALKDVLLRNNVNARFISFPSDGPFGHQIRVVESGRYSMDSIPNHMLRMVDRMDTFLNPHNGLNKLIDEFDCLILTESQFKEALAANDPALGQWIIEINSNIPTIDLIYWLAERDEEIQTTSGLPRFEVIGFSPSNELATAQSLAMKIMSEVKYA